MNDVKINSAEPIGRSGSVASSQRNPAPVRQETETQVSRGLIDAQRQMKELIREQSKEEVEKTKESVQEAVTRLNDYVQSVQRDLQFQLDDHSGKTVVTVIDSRTNEVVRQIPDDVALRLARDLQQDEPLSLFNAKV